MIPWHVLLPIVAAVEVAAVVQFVLFWRSWGPEHPKP